MGYYHNRNKQTNGLDFKIKNALIFAPICFLLDLFIIKITNDWVYAFLIILGLIYIFTGYFTAQSYHRLMRNRARQSLFDKMSIYGGISGLISFIISGILLIIFYILSNSLELTFFSAIEFSKVFLFLILFLGIGLIFGSLGGFLYKKINRPRIMTHR